MGASLIGPGLACLYLRKKKVKIESFLRILVLFLVTVVKEVLSSLALKQIYSIALEILSF